jgi:hypothetical protein
MVRERNESEAQRYFSLTCLTGVEENNTISFNLAARVAYIPPLAPQNVRKGRKKGVVLSSPYLSKRSQAGKRSEEVIREEKRREEGLLLFSFA